MLAVIGFVSAGVLFILFAISCQSLRVKQALPSLRRFLLAYYLLAATFLLFGAASAVGTQKVLGAAVMVGDAVLIVATFLILQILLEHNRRKDLWLHVAVGVGIGLVLVRLLFFYPNPFMQDGVLFFNSPRFVSFTLAAVFLLIWLPVNLRTSQLLAPKIRSLTGLYPFLYVSATLSATIFLLAKTPLSVILTFTALSVSFLMLVLSNLYAKAIKEAHHGK